MKTVKKVITAFIEQELQFDSKLEYLAYMESLKQSKKQFKEVQYKQLESGEVVITVRKQYNNNVFPH